MAYETLVEKLAAVEGGPQSYCAFLDIVMGYHTVVVWSSAQEGLADQVIERRDFLRRVVKDINPLGTSDQELGDLVANELRPRAEHHSRP